MVYRCPFHKFAIIVISCTLTTRYFYVKINNFNLVEIREFPINDRKITETFGNNTREFSRWSNQIRIRALFVSE